MEKVVKNSEIMEFEELKRVRTLSQNLNHQRQKLEQIYTA